VRQRSTYCDQTGALFRHLRGFCGVVYMRYCDEVKLFLSCKVVSRESRNST
jgi:hypothetical protein